MKFLKEEEEYLVWGRFPLCIPQAHSDHTHLVVTGHPHVGGYRGPRDAARKSFSTCICGTPMGFPLRATPCCLEFDLSDEEEEGVVVGEEVVAPEDDVLTGRPTFSL